MVSSLPTPRITAPNWGKQLNDAIESRYVASLAATEAVSETVDVIEGVMLPSGVMEGRVLFQYGPSRGVAVTAGRLHFNRIRRRITSGFWFNGSVAGFCAMDSATFAYGAVTGVRQGNGENEWLPGAAAVGTWANKANQAGVLLTWPFGNDARLDGMATINSTPAKAQASAKNGLHALIAMARAERRLESVSALTYTTTNGSPDVTGNVASSWFRGMLVTGTGVPANTYVGDMINGGLGGFKLSSSRSAQVNVNATVTGSASLVFSPVYTGTWAAATNSGFSGGQGWKSNSTSPTVSYAITLPEARRLQWVTSAIDDAQYVAAGAPFGGTGGMGYSIVIDGGTPITGTTSDQHRQGTLGLSFGPKAVDLGVLSAGFHEIVITGTGGASKLMVDDCLLIESLTPLTTVVMKEVELPAQYYTLNSATGASYAKTVTYNGFIDDEVALWPNDDSVITLDPVDFGYDKALHVSAADGAYAHFNDAGERVMADGIMAALNALPGRAGLVWV